jgi:hypothetical protein
MAHALKELFGQFDWVQRSLIFIYVGLEQGADQLHISPVRATQVKGSIRPIHLEMATGLPLQIAAPHRHTVAATNIGLVRFQECP